MDDIEMAQICDAIGKSLKSDRQSVIITPAIIKQCISRLKSGKDNGDVGLFGFKEKHSTSLCTLMYSEIINHYTNNKSNVYSCLLEASKAFDLVHFGKLLEYYCLWIYQDALYDLILDSYIRQRVLHGILHNLCKFFYCKMSFSEDKSTQFSDNETISIFFAVCNN